MNLALRQILIQMFRTHKLCSLHACHRTSLIAPTVPVYSSRNERLERLVIERKELDNAMSWLSTLGGAFSALGEESIHCVSMLHKLPYCIHWLWGGEGIHTKFKSHWKRPFGGPNWIQENNIKNFREMGCEGLKY